jgi:hypothetical protein
MHDARMMSQVDRRAALQILAELEGGIVDEKTGEVTWPDRSKSEEK